VRVAPLRTGLKKQVAAVLEQMDFIIFLMKFGSENAKPVYMSGLW
jgi:hypothetical protein